MPIVFVLHSLFQSDYAISDSNKIKVTEHRMYIFINALIEFNNDIGRFPTTDEGLYALLSNKNLYGWQGPYLNYSFVPRDSWGSQYAYKYLGNNKYNIYSFGPNKTNEYGYGDDIQAENN